MGNMALTFPLREKIDRLEREAVGKDAKITHLTEVIKSYASGELTLMDLVEALGGGG